MRKLIQEAASLFTLSLRIFSAAPATGLRSRWRSHTYSAGKAIRCAAAANKPKQNMATAMKGLTAIQAKVLSIKTQISDPVRCSRRPM